MSDYPCFLVVLLFTANCTLNFDEVNNICLEESPPSARGKSFLTCGNRSIASRQSALECKATAPLPLGNNGTHALSGTVLVKYKSVVREDGEGSAIRFLTVHYMTYL